MLRALNYRGLLLLPGRPSPGLDIGLAFVYIRPTPGLQILLRLLTASLQHVLDEEVVDVRAYHAADERPDSYRVVTSDRRLVERARELGARVTSSGSFRRRLERALADGPA